MACEICNKSSCTRSFHTLEDQQDFDNKVDEVKETLKRKLLSGLNGLPDLGDSDDEYLVSYAAVEALIEDILW